jgi:hypothetical protein
MRHGDDHEPVDPLGAAYRGQPGHRRAEVMPDHVRGLEAERVEYPGHIADGVCQPVRGHVAGALGPSQSAQVRCDHPEPVRHQERHLMPPQPRRIRETVQQHDRGTSTLIGHVQGDAVHLDKLLRHGSIVSRATR